MMTRKDYVATAEILNGFKDLIGDQLVFEFSEWFSADNPRFDETRFWDACVKEMEPA